MEYRVWCHPDEGADDRDDGSDYFYPFAAYLEALEFSRRTRGADVPIALIRQLEYIDEPEAGQYIHVKEVRIAEWPVEFLHRPRRNEKTILDFLSPDALARHPCAESYLWTAPTWRASDDGRAVPAPPIIRGIAKE